MTHKNNAHNLVPTLLILINAFAGIIINNKMVNAFLLLKFKIALLEQSQMLVVSANLFALGITIILIKHINVFAAQIIHFGTLLKENALVLVDSIKFKDNVFLLANLLRLELETNV